MMTRRDNVAVTNSYTQPCDEMSIGINAYQTTKPTESLINQSIFEITIKYPEKTYYEITNNQAFGFESFWSSVGGFVGIFLGFSLLQLPEFIIGVMRRINDKFHLM